MNKADLIDKIATDANLPKKDAAVVLTAITENITKELKKKDGKVTLIGFGTFEKTHRKARTGRNPKTGEPMKIKASNAVKFKVGATLKKSAE